MSLRKNALKATAAQWIVRKHIYKIKRMLHRVCSRDGRSLIFLTPRPLRLRKGLLRVRSSSANHRNIQLQLQLHSAKLRILL